MIIIILESWTLAFSLTNFKLAWKRATLLALLMPKHYSDLSVLHIIIIIIIIIIIYYYYYYYYTIFIVLSWVCYQHYVNTNHLWCFTQH